MLKSLNIDTYLNGYNVTHIGCIDIPIAGASGYFKYDNYFFYCFYYTFFNNWTRIDTNEFLGFKNSILSKLGLEMRKNIVNNKNDLLGLIKNKIDNECPVIMLARYKDLFYSRGNNSLHGILVTDYDSDKSVIVIREFVHIRDSIKSVVRADLLAKLQLSDHLVTLIWEEANSSFSKEGSTNHNIVYSIEKKSVSTINSYKDLIDDIIHNYCFSDSKFAQFIRDLDYIFDEFNDDNRVEYFRRTFCGSMVIFFEVLERCLTIIDLKQDYKLFFNELKEKYVMFRNKVIAKINAEALRGNMIGREKKREMISNIQALDEELFKLICKLYYETYGISK